MAKPYRTLRAQMAPEAHRQAEDKARALLAGDTPPPARPQPTLAELAQAFGLLGQPPYVSQLAAQQAQALQALQAVRDAAAGLETPEGRA